MTLMDRTDVKFVMPINRLPAVLVLAQGHYRVLELDGKRLFSYETLYYDTPDLDLYHKHQAGHLNRYKVRLRNYLDSNLSFLEVKFKSNKGRTVKTRIAKPLSEMQPWDAQSESFLKENLPLEDPNNLRPVLWVNYDRLTLVGIRSKERITIDLNLTFVSGERQKEHSHLVVVEIKQEKESAQSVFRHILQRKRIRAGGISKYCFGVASIHRHVKSNRLKPKLRRFQKLRKQVASNGYAH